MVEEWREVEGWNLYEISNLGKIRVKDRLTRNGNGEFIRKVRMIKPAADKLGYTRCVLKQDGKVYYAKIHRLVAMAFIPNPENKPCVNHIDNNPRNNRVDNLEWVTMKENSAWSHKQGRDKRTSDWLNHLHKSQEKFYTPVIGTNVETGETVTFHKLNDVREMGFLPSMVCCCCKSERKTHHGYMWRYVEKGGTE